MPQTPLSLQEQFAPLSVCYGCGPANPQGLQIKSHVSGDSVVAKFTPASHHHAFPNVLNGGIIATILDCHCNWAACWYLMQHQKLDTPPCTVTAKMEITLKKPTPLNSLTLVARCVKASENKATISADLKIGDVIYDQFIGEFVIVSPDHPAFQRW